MRCWILRTNLEAYKQLCAQEGHEPYILEETEDKVHVEMTNNTASIWHAVGYWCELG